MSGSVSKELLLENIPFKDIPLFSELGMDQIKLITSICKTEPYKKNSFIFLSGEIYKGFYIVLKGTVKVYKITPTSGKETILHIIRPFSVFADVPLFEGKNYPVNAQALEDSLLLFVPKDGFIRLLETNVQICLKMLAGFAKRMKYLTQRVDEMSNKEVTGRLAEYLIEEIEKSKRIIIKEPVLRLNIPKSAIASYLGTITETLSRAFRKLQDDDIIRVDGKKIIIRNLSRLKELSLK